MSDGIAIEARELCKSFGDVRALHNVALDVSAASVFGGLSVWSYRRAIGS